MPPETRRGPWWSRPGAVLHAAVSFWARGRPWAGTYLPLVRRPVETRRRPERPRASRGSGLPAMPGSDRRRYRASFSDTPEGVRCPRALAARRPERILLVSTAGVGARRDSRARSRRRASNSSGARARAGSGSAVATCSLAHRQAQTHRSAAWPQVVAAGRLASKTVHTSTSRPIAAAALMPYGAASAPDSVLTLWRGQAQAPPWSRRLERADVRRRPRSQRRPA
jgi:hypothetical protein